MGGPLLCAACRAQGAAFAAYCLNTLCACACQLHQMIVLPALQCSPGRVLWPLHAQQALHEQGHTVRLLAGDQVPATKGSKELNHPGCWHRAPPELRVLELVSELLFAEGHQHEDRPLCIYRRYGITSYRTIAAPMLHLFSTTARHCPDCMWAQAMQSTFLSPPYRPLNLAW